jgi:hypothetical protein
MNKSFNYIAVFLFFLFYFQGCAIYNRFGTVEKQPADLYQVNGQYIWDNWIVADNGKLHRYALSASSTEYKPQERHGYAYLRYAFSEDGKKTWHDKGAVLEKSDAIPLNNESYLWPNLVIWSGSALLHQDRMGNKEFILFFTGRSQEDEKIEDLFQRIGVATSKNGQDFTIKAIFSPEDQCFTSQKAENTCKTICYDITDDDGIIMAWRDPYVFQDKNNPQKWHMIFAAKSKDGCGAIRPTVGHAVAETKENESLIEVEWQLQRPFELPQYYRQLEIPNIIYRKGKYYLFVSTQNNPRMTSNEEKEAAYRGYVAENITGPWKLVYGDTDKIYGHNIYGITVFENQNGNYAAVGFYSEETKCALTGTPLIKICWNGEMPKFIFEEAIEGCIGEN